MDQLRQNLSDVIDKHNQNQDRSIKVIKSEVDKLMRYRSHVDNRSDLKVHLRNYAGLIFQILNHYKVTAEYGKDIGFTSVVSSLRLLEESKENLGKLRATMTGLFGKDKPFDNAVKNNLVSLHTGVKTNVNSPLLSMSEKSKKQIKSFATKASWIEVDEKYHLILKKSEVGNFGVDVAKFFTVISSNVRNINDVVVSEFKIVRDAEVGAAMVEQKFEMILALCIAVLGTIAMIIFSYLTVSKINSSLSGLIKSLYKGATIVLEESGNLSGNSLKLSEFATKNSSAIQETAASVEEISSMVKNSVGEAEKSKQISDEANVTSTEINQKMDELLSSMQSIIQSNQEIENLVKIFEEISDKTKVIDDIVFQTNILSFNASVEAERAGELGRGFGVVAREVSNLAQLSGKAATEISAIVKESTKSAERVAVENKEKVLHGNELLSEVSEFMGKITKNLTNIEKSSEQILVSSSDQSEGIGQINKAISELDLTTQKNVMLAEKTSLSSQKLGTQATVLETAVEDLVLLVEGQNKKGSSVSRAEGVEPVNKANVLSFDRAEEFDHDEAPLKTAAGGEDMALDNSGGWDKM